MRKWSTALVMTAFLTALRLGAQVAVMPAAVAAVTVQGNSTTAPEMLVLGTTTGVSYDSNALSSNPAVANVEYTLYPLIGLRLTRPRWDALISFVPGLSYNSANLPQYQRLSLVSGASLEFRPTERFRLNLVNTLVSSSNPFVSLLPNSSAAPAGGTTSTVNNLNYLPRTNELATADASYNLSAKASLFAQVSYNYFGYENNPNLPSAAQPIQQSSSTLLSAGISRGLSAQTTENVRYTAQIIDAGQGRVKTLGQSVEYGIAWTPRPTFRLSVIAGPEYVENEVAGLLPTGGALNLGAHRVSGWTWTGNAAVSERFGQNEVSLKASRQLGMGNQYQGSAQQTSVEVDFTRHLPWRTEMVLFGSYNTNTPAFVAQSIARLSNNYSSSGATFSKAFTQRWTLSATYWYLLQNRPQTTEQIYAGNHNRVAISLSYALSKPLSQ